MQNDLTQELSTNFIDYAYAVNTDRAIPDAKPGSWSARSTAD